MNDQGVKEECEVNHYSNQSLPDMRRIEEVVGRIFSFGLLAIERVVEGVSTYVYRIISGHEIFYLRVLPEEGASFAPEAVVHAQLGQRLVKVPEIIYFESCNDLLQRSIMVKTEIKGQSINQSNTLRKDEQKEILREVGRDLACINTMRVEGLGWIQRDSHDTNHLRAEWPTYRMFALEYWEADLAYLAREDALSPSEVTMLERVLFHYDPYLNCEQECLTHGDFDATHIYQEGGCYTGIIDFGEIRGTDRWYDLGHFHMRDGEQLLSHLEAALVRGYGETMPLPPDYEQRIRFTGLLINVRALARSLQKRPANRYTQHQLKVLRKDLAFLL
ncbi:MAG TPA: aminoglycoside phosphotransferase family protein [Ktedonobacteraceae bacterium]|jgi:aminoglycoside phosphotransferase (APT) family kinase protein|nr:aminoglycoside phosphotransferase family protein [Ktedonobacteraceae bacterium]